MELGSGTDQQTGQEPFACNDGFITAEQWPGNYKGALGNQSLDDLPVLMPGWNFSQNTSAYKIDKSKTYGYDVGETLNFVSDVEMDENGKVTSLSKPLYTEADREALNGKLKTEGSGMYRFRLVESSVSPEKLGDSQFGQPQKKAADQTAGGCPA